MGLKIVFMGTPGFARHMLESLVTSSHSVVGVVTVPDKPAGRGQQLRESEVKQFAKEKQLTILQPMSLKDPAFLTELRALNADVFVVVAFRMLPEVVWKMPRLGTLNLHASLLPNYRGAAPINWAIINGDKHSGLTTFFINEEIDCGAIIKQCTIAIQPDWTAGILHDAMLVPGAQLLIETLSSIEKNEVIPMPQPNSEALNSAPKLTKLNTKIEFDRPGNEIVQHILGLSPYPSAYCLLIHQPTQKTQNLKILDAHFIEGKSSNTPFQSKEGIFFPCKDGLINITRLQLEGKRAMSYKEFIAGNDIVQYALSK